MYNNKTWDHPSSWDQIKNKNIWFGKYKNLITYQQLLDDKSISNKKYIEWVVGMSSLCKTPEIKIFANEFYKIKDEFIKA